VLDHLLDWKMKTEPNKAMERSRILVTVRADARPAPSIRLAHLGR
jgi:endo-beta-N-acetylglucosaminidase D